MERSNSLRLRHLVNFYVTSDVGQTHEENSFVSSGTEGNNIVRISKESDLSNHVWVMDIAD